MLEMLGAERLVYGRLGDATVHAAHRGHAGTAEAGRRPCRLHVGREHLHWFDARDGSAAYDMTALALPAAGSPTAAPASWRRRTRWRRSALGAAHGYRAFECDVKLSADGVPFLLHDATLERTTRRPRRGRRAALGRAVAAGRRRLAQPRLCRRAAAQPGGASPRYVPAQRLRAEHRDQADAGPEQRHRPRRGRARRHACGPARPLPPLLSSFQPEALHGARDTAPRPAARAAARHAVGRLVRDGAARSAAWPWSPTTALMDAALIERAARRRPARAGLHGQRPERGARGCSALGIDGLITDAVDRFPAHGHARPDGSARLSRPLACGGSATSGLGAQLIVGSSRAPAAHARRASAAGARPPAPPAARRTPANASDARRPTCSPSQPPISAPGPAGSRISQRIVLVMRPEQRRRRDGLAQRQEVDEDQHRADAEAASASPRTRPTPKALAGATASSSQPTPQTAKPSTRQGPGPMRAEMRWPEHAGRRWCRRPGR